MSYPFDPAQMRLQGTAKLNQDVAVTRLLARRTARQSRRASRAI